MAIWAERMAASFPSLVSCIALEGKMIWSSLRSHVTPHTLGEPRFPSGLPLNGKVASSGPMIKGFVRRGGVRVLQNGSVPGGGV